MSSERKRVVVLGSTGSIGRQTLEVVRALPERFSILGLAAGSNVAGLAQQVAEFQPEMIFSTGGAAGAEKGDVLDGLRYGFTSPEAMAEDVRADIVVVAIPGKAALGPLLAAVRAGKTVALASKEALVTAGSIIIAEAERSGATLLPVDSEHSAIWQCLQGETSPPGRLMLTASGGPFRGYTGAELASVSAEDALRHPSWNMGKKVTIDSATLFNKGLEVIEAHWLFGVPMENVEVIIHPQSVVHSMVEFADGSVKAQLSRPDMRLSIQYALTYPERLPSPVGGIDWSLVPELTFEAPDYETFPCLHLAVMGGQKGHTYPAVVCAADEVAVELFLSGRIAFSDIPRLLEGVLQTHQPSANPSLEVIEAADEWARHEVIRMWEGST